MKSAGKVREDVIVLPDPASPADPRPLEPFEARGALEALDFVALADRLPPELAAYVPLVHRLARAGPVSLEHSALVDAALGVWIRPGFETFVSLPRLRFEPFPYQLQAAQRALRRMQGRAILADEVGLGKTIEAALVASELRLRGLAGRVLVLAPTGLVEQWQEELDRKFALPSVVVEGRRWDRSGPPGEEPIFLAPLASARRSPLRDQLVAVDWDLVIADEAHRMRKPNSASGRLLRSLRTRHLLLLTATPVQNRLEDLYQLVTLVRPGHLGTPKEFRARFGAMGAEAPGTNLPELRSRIREVMVRHRRSEVPVVLPGRLAETVRVLPAPEEWELYRAVSERVREQGREASAAHALALRSIQRLAGSNPPALAPTLQKMGWSDLAARASAVTATEKARTLVGLLRSHAGNGDKTVVFCAFRQTLGLLRQLAEDEEIPATVYHGSLSRRAKEEAVRAFRSEVPLLLTTEAAGEGRNLQFCHVMVNFDLPWNPMQIEQRLGRIHRIGQDQDVLLTNLVTRGTVEDRILRVLQTKINLFELVVGELDMILGRVDEDFDFEAAVFAAHVASRDDREFAVRLEALGEEIARARREYLQSRTGNDLLVGEAGP